MPSDPRVLVIGAGVSGLSTAIHLAEAGLKVTVISKAPWQISNSYLAQGGIAAAISSDDDPLLHAQDTLTVTRGLAHFDRVTTLTDSAREVVARLIEEGVVARTADGRADLAQEAGHSRARIVHAPDGLTGRAVTSYLIQRAKSLSGIDWIQGRVIGLGTHRPRVVGAFVSTGRETSEFILARAVVLATGGMAGLYQISSNPWETSGDGLMLAFSAGATLADLEFVQFHPTILSGGETRPNLLLSEALRGAGAHLLNAQGHRIMATHPALELAPRDEVAQAVFTHRPVYLSMAHIPDRVIHEHFSGIAEAVFALGWDLTRDLIPVSAGAHFSMGGVVVDALGGTGTDGLYAVGEIAMAGLHGANRLASNSLLEGLVYGQRTAHAILGEASRAASGPPDASSWLPNPAYWTIPAGLPEAMDRYLGVIREGSSLESFCEYLKHLPESHAKRLAEMATVSALLRKESRGAHIRRDYPNQQSRYQGHFLHHQSRSPWFEPIPTPIPMPTNSPHTRPSVASAQNGPTRNRTEDFTR